MPHTTVLEVLHGMHRTACGVRWGGGGGWAVNNATYRLVNKTLQANEHHVDVRNPLACTPLTQTAACLLHTRPLQYKHLGPTWGFRYRTKDLRLTIRVFRPKTTSDLSLTTRVCRPKPALGEDRSNTAAQTQRGWRQ